MENRKIKFALWLWPETKEMVESTYQSDNCSSQSEYIEKAILFYSAYRNAQNAAEFLPEALATMITGTLDQFADRMGALLYKLAVEQNIFNHILATDTDIDAETYQAMRGKSVYEVKRTNGRVTLKDVLQSEKGV